MKSIIIYYSQTGSTQKIAKAIQKGITNSTGQCDIARLKEVQPNNLKEYDLIGFGGPVWGMGTAVNVQAFMENITSLEGKHSLYFCTHGTAPGESISMAVDTLKKRGLTVIGWNNWYGSVFIPYQAKPYYTDGHPDEIDLKEAEDFGKEIAERSRLISQGATNLIPVLPEGKDYTDIYGENLPPHDANQEGYEARTRPFKVDKEKCNQCNLCADNCPTNNIDVSSSIPVFKNVICCGPRVMRCWNCEQICPTGAIEYDWEACYLANAKFPWRQGSEKLLKKAESEGRFRRLIPFDKVGWDTPWYMVSNHPRIKAP